ncbi:MAG: MazG family protein [Mycobacteriaceae bacterium]|nr:MazG family protein [Mycobacteriaceae bacterium]
MDRLWGFGGWEVEQTHETLRPYLVEETYELLDAFDGGDDAEIASELGDLLLQVLFHARIAQAQGRFTVDDVARALVDKLTRRSPHLTNGHTGPLDAVSQDAAWHARKTTERSGSCLDGIPPAQPSLALAEKIIARSRKAGLPDDLVPAELRAVRLDGSGQAEARLRAAALAFADRFRAAEARAAEESLRTPMSAEQWYSHWC